MPNVDRFEDLEAEFMRRVQRTVWATVVTVDRKGRPRGRILHPVWEGSTGWIFTGRHTLKEKHLAGNPFVSLTYWDPQHEQIHAECRADWVDSESEKRRAWDLFKTTPEPYGYDPAIIPGWERPEDPELGLLRLTPWRVELFALGDPGSGMVWHA